MQNVIQPLIQWKKQTAEIIIIPVYYINVWLLLKRGSWYLFIYRSWYFYKHFKMARNYYKVRQVLKTTAITTIWDIG